MKYFLWLLRIILGVLFIFSGVVKANDPMGLVYKMNEFFEVLHMSFMIPYSFFFSVTMIAFEIVCGVAVIVGYAFRLFSILLLLLNIFFTFLTGYALYSGKIKECGCFGACIPLSPEATFYKDVVLTIMSFIVYVYRGRISSIFGKHTSTATFILSVVFAAGIQWWALEHLPFVDCIGYKPGNNIWEKMQPGPGFKPAVYESVFIYEKNGEKKEFDMNNYPWQDSTWKFVDRKDKLVKEAEGEPEIHDFVLNDSNNADQTKAILTAKGYTLFWIVREPDKAHMDNLDKLRNLVSKAAQLNVPFYALSSSNYEEANAFLFKHGIKLPPFSVDGTASKTAMRSNPGLMLIKDGVVVKKWSYRDYPSDMALNGDVLEMK
ncbi:MAG: DoxX family protein [Flavipsychrobacter sp.]|jgi:uncharacterized membrane protein YphA (DoxX/SURF4 family)|nr:DoxX family protein [Flavipsychrobacter sp.]